MSGFGRTAVHPSGRAVAWLVALAPVLAVAQSAEVRPLEHIIVEATGADRERENIPAAVGVVDATDVQLGQQQLGLDESLVKVPGLFMLDRYNFAQDLRVSIRGFGARANFGIRGIKIVVDGIPETLPDGQGQVDSIDLGSVGQVEVIRGPYSALYGNASGGVINITTERGADEPFIEGRSAVGEFGFRKHQLKLGGASGRVNYLLSATDLVLDGYRENSETESRQLNGRLGFEIDDRSDLTVVFNAVDSPLANDPGGISAEDVEADRRQARDANVDFAAGESLEQQRLGLVYTRSLGENHEIRLRNYYVSRDFDNRLPFTDGGAVDLERFFFGGGFSYTYTGTIAGRDNRLIVGFDLDSQDDDRRRYNNEQGVRGDLTFDQNEAVTSSGIFVQNELSLREDLGLTAGVRQDRVRFKVSDAFLTDDTGDDSGSLSFEETSFVLGLLWSATPSMNVYANVSSSFETPTTTELANPGGQGGFNPALKPQTAMNYEIGIKGTLRDRHWYELAVFSIDVDDELIPFEVASQPGRDFFQNAGKSGREGIELAFTARPTESLSASIAYTYSDFTFETFMDDSGDFSGNRIPGTPENLLHAEIAYSHSAGFYGVWDALYVDRLFLNNANSEVSGSYVVSNLRLGHAWGGQRWTVAPFIGVSNLFDEKYNGNVRVNAFGGRFFEPAPERNVYGGVRVNYRFID